MVITAKRGDVCVRCQSAIAAGDKINWTRGVYTVTHAVCPTGADRVMVVPSTDRAAGRRQYASNYEITCPECSGKINVGDQILWARGQKSIHLECPPKAQVEAANAAETARNDQRLEAIKRVPKGIYRVSLTGQEDRYGITHINVNLIPSEKYGSTKVGEWRGDSVGRINQQGAFVFWPSVENREAPRVKAVLAALDIILGSADPTEFAKAYAVASENCWRCGADLVDETSRTRLMGPDCYRMQYGKGE